MLGQTVMYEHLFWCVMEYPGHRVNYLHLFILKDVNG